MAKTRMTCPFSSKLCVECAAYRGRHYYLRFFKEYRGYLGKPRNQGASSNKRFEMPSVILTNAQDPFTTTL